MIPLYVYSRKRDGPKRLSPNFRVSEFACRDGSDPVFIAPALVELLQTIRTHYGQPVRIVSGYRTPGYNAKVDGAAQSQHTYGTAADIQISGVAPAALAAYAGQLLGNSGGIGTYKTFVHLDVREDPARWKG